ncbi:hypothetical protein SFUMM280S_00800 [Streptomyces fumanus]
MTVCPRPDPGPPPGPSPTPSAPVPSTPPPRSTPPTAPPTRPRSSTPWNTWPDHPLAGARVADIGSGTGISTALLHARGADVIAVEPGAGMAAQFRATLPDVPIVRGTGNALPLARHSADLLTYAQAWHWTDPVLAVPEALRVLRPGGALALWWNTSATDIPWIAAAADRVVRHAGLDINAERRAIDARAADPTGRLDLVRREIRWSRRVPLDTHLANIASHSVFLVLGEERTAAYLAESADTS